MKSPRARWSLLIFGFNEGKTLPSVVDDCARVLAAVGTQDSEILYVDDGSSDGSADIAEKLRARVPALRVLRHPTNRGIGEALRTGYAAAQGQQIAAVPADGQFEISLLASVGLLGPEEFVAFYRVDKLGYSFFRHLLSDGNRWMNRWLNGIVVRDVNWVKVYPVSTLHALDLRLRSSLVESEIVAKLLKRGFRVRELPSRYLPRTAGVARGASLNLVRRAALETWQLFRILRSFPSAR